MGEGGYILSYFCNENTKYTLSNLAVYIIKCNHQMCQIFLEAINLFLIEILYQYSILLICKEMLDNITSQCVLITLELATSNVKNDEENIAMPSALCV